MCTHTIKFELPDEKEELHCALKGSSYIACLQKFDNYLRSKIKHEDLEDTVYASYIEIRQQLYKKAEDCGFSIWY